MTCRDYLQGLASSGWITDPTWFETGYYSLGLGLPFGSQIFFARSNQDTSTATVDVTLPDVVGEVNVTINCMSNATSAFQTLLWWDNQQRIVYCPPTWENFSYNFPSAAGSHKLQIVVEPSNTLSYQVWAVRSVTAVACTNESLPSPPVWAVLLLAFALIALIMSVLAIARLVLKRRRRFDIFSEME